MYACMHARTTSTYVDVHVTAFFDSAHPSNHENTSGRYNIQHRDDKEHVRTKNKNEAVLEKTESIAKRAI